MEIDRITRVPRTQRPRKMVMGAVRLFRVYLKSCFFFFFFFFRPLGRGKKQLRDRCNLPDSLVRVFKIRGFISFLFPFLFIHLLFSHIIPPIFDILRREISQPKPYLKLASARSEGNVN